jgi:hypothetical protein
MELGPGPRRYPYQAEVKHSRDRTRLFQPEVAYRVDASPVGLACVMAQYNPAKPKEKYIVMNVSRSLTAVERRYCQVEREALAVVWACERRHYYIYGCEFDLNTDNKAVQLIFGNAKSQPKARIE